MSFQNLIVERLVIHEVYPREEDRTMKEPSYGTEVQTLTGESHAAFCNRITSALGNGSKSVQLEIVNVGEGSCADLAKKLVDADDTLFVSLSKSVARRLAAAQASRKIPGGLVVVFTGTAGYPTRRHVGFLKAEYHEGFARRADDGGRMSLQFLKDLFLTPQSRFYKIGAFIEREPETHLPYPGGWEAVVYDDLVSSANRMSAANYFYDGFLGCRFPETNARRTREFYDYTRQFVGALSVPAEQKIELNNALYTYLKVEQTPVLQVMDFAQRYFAEAEVRDSYEQFMTGKEFPQTAVSKDLVEVQSKLKLRKIEFKEGFRLTGPAEKFNESIQIEAIDGPEGRNGQIPKWTRITVRDQIKAES